MADETTAINQVRQAAGGRIERARVFLSEVRNELKRVTWPGRKEVYSTTVVVIIVSIFFGLYLWGLDQLLLRIIQSIFRFFGVVGPA
jgi:preprotein translocase subunit SecE